MSELSAAPTGESSNNLASDSAAPNGDAWNGASEGDIIAEAIAATRGSAPAPSEPAAIDKPAVVVDKKVDSELAANTGEKALENTPKSSEWAEFHKQKKALFAREQALKEKEERYSKFDSLKDQDRVEAIKLMGFEDPVKFIEELAETGGKVTPEMQLARKLQAELESLKAERQKDLDAKEAQGRESEAKAAVDKLNADIVSFLKNTPKFANSVLTAKGGNEAVFQAMQDHYQKTADQETGVGEVLSFEKAAELVETSFKQNVQSMLETPAVRQYIVELLNKSPSKPAAASQKPAVANKLQPTQLSEEDPDTDGDKLLEQASAWMRKQQAARRGW